MEGDGGQEKPRAHQVADGEFAGWWTGGGRDAFESLVGPFYSTEIDGEAVCAFRAEPRHMNGLGLMHGGCMLTFADYALFAISRRARGGLRGSGLTVSLNGEFLGPARVGERVEARGEVTRAGRSLIFVRGLLTAEGRPMLSFSGVIKALRPRGEDASPPPPAPAA